MGRCRGGPGKVQRKSEGGEKGSGMIHGRGFLPRDQRPGMKDNRGTAQ